MFNKKQQQNTTSEEEQIDLSDKVSIYVMPKSIGGKITKSAGESVGSDSFSGGERKNVGPGIIIFAVGAIILIVMSYFLYKYLLGSNANNEPTESTLPVVSKEVVKEEDKGDGDNSIKKEEAPQVVIKEKKEKVSKIASKPVVDTDKDGLSDLEEIVFKTSKDIKDTDGDGFNDLSEVLNKYNPSGNGKIIENVGLREYVNEKYKYAMYIPRDWKLENVDGEKSIIIKTPDNQMLQVGVSLNLNKQPIEDWYREQFDAKLIEQKNKFTISGVDAIKRDMGRHVYIAYAGNIYNIAYVVGEGVSANYQNLFNMMVSSFKFTNVE